LVPTIVRVAVDQSGKIFWNGKPISFEKFSEFVSAAHRMNPEPQVFLEIEAGTPCEELERVRDEMDRKLACDRNSVCSEGVFTIWEKVPTPSRTAVS
jgi:hypothetical protein